MHHSHGRIGPYTSSGVVDDTHLPTRLIDVGVDADSYVRLWETSPEDTGIYAALSHPWGEPPHFCTFRHNLDRHKIGIAIADLPATFRDAVLTTRALRLRYLWIDSICIVQGPDGDFNAEAQRMEQVFSAANCVLAAGCTKGQTDGFLKPRYERDYVPLSRSPGEAPLYVCEIIDDFNRHGQEGRLSSRGWVLQEHALARRTIFFTEYQTYWECGDGVRCESGTKMSNSLAAFLGDTNFPQMIMSASKGERILRYQDLYKTYSRLGLSNAYDRPYALDGLQSRVLKAFNTEGGHGIFDEGPHPRLGHLRRSLLWCRGADVERMDRITFPVNRATVVPSWSWMACEGGIDYLELDFDKIEWADLRSPWWRESWGRAAEPMPRLAPGGGMALGGLGQAFDLGKAPGGNGGGEAELIFDRPDEALRPGLLCVVLGVGLEPAPRGARRNYVLVVAPDPEPAETWERIGAGYLPKRCISHEGSPIVIR